MLVAPHLTQVRLARLAEVDPEFTLELLKIDSQLAEMLPDYIGRDLCKWGAVPTESVSLAEAVLEGKNPFRERADAAPVR